MSSSSTSSPTDNSSHGSVALSSALNPSLNPVSGTNTSSQKPFSLSERLNFEIYRYSSYSPNYLPE